MKWKDGAKFALCLTHDVDRVKKKWYHYGYYLLKKGVSSQASSLKDKIKGNEPYDNFEYVISKEKEFGATSTFLFLNERVRKLDPKFMGRYKMNDKRILKALDIIKSNGCEIGFHGSYYSFDNEAMLISEKEFLDKLCGEKVISTRQHHLNFSEHLTWVAQKKSGILFDSTKGFNDHVGLELPTRPYFTAEGILEFPMTVMDTVNLTDHMIVNDIWEAMDKICEDSGVMTLNFHQCKFNQYDHPEIVELYSEILKRAKQKKAWIASMGEIGKWLIEQNLIE